VSFLLIGGTGLYLLERVEKEESLMNRLLGNFIFLNRNF
jgi:hypothetical protein